MGKPVLGAQPDTEHLLRTGPPQTEFNGDLITTTGVLSREELQQVERLARAIHDAGLKALTPIDIHSINVFPDDVLPGKAIVHAQARGSNSSAVLWVLKLNPTLRELEDFVRSVQETLPKSCADLPLLAYCTSYGGNPRAESTSFSFTQSV